MKNIVFLLVDSLSQTRLEKEDGKNLMPFVFGKEKEMHYYSNMFSQGPYTEAGTKSLFCGTNVLNSYGYLLRFNRSSSFITSIFKDKGFETYNINYPTALMPVSKALDTDHIFHNSYFMYDVLYEQKIKYYIDLFENNEFDKNDLKDCFELFDSIFEIWISFLNDAVLGNNSIILIRDYLIPENVKEGLEILRREFAEYVLDKEKYLLKLFSEKDEHILLKIKCPIKDNFINSKIINAVWKEQKNVINSIKRKQYWSNLINNHVDSYFFKRIFIKLKNHNVDRYLFGEPINLIHHIHKGKEISSLYNSTKRYVNMVSCNRQLNLIPEILSSNKKDKFILCHVEEPHNYCTFFSFDSNSKTTVTNEILSAKKYCDSLPHNYKGLIAYDLSLLYVDDCIKRLYFELEQRNLLKDTIIIITGDHGTSYCQTPPRDRDVINFYVENYKVPLIILDANNKGLVKKTELFDNSQVLSILLNYLSLKSPADINCCSPREYIFVEFMGSGCPDIRRRPVWLSIRNNDYVINYVGKLSSDFNEKYIKSIFFIKNDNSEKNNLLSLRNEEINNLISKLRERFMQLKNEYKEIIL